jgi:hypothetical protein
MPSLWVMTSLHQIHSNSSTFRIYTYYHGNDEVVFRSKFNVPYLITLWVFQRLNCDTGCNGIMTPLRTFRKSLELTKGYMNFGSRTFRAGLSVRKKFFIAESNHPHSYFHFTSGRNSGPKNPWAEILGSRNCPSLCTQP